MLNLIDENCKLYDDRRNVERKLVIQFHINNCSSDIPAGDKVDNLLIVKDFALIFKTNYAN